MTNEERAHSIYHGRPITLQTRIWKALDEAERRGADTAIAAEREACAKLVETNYAYSRRHATMIVEIVAAIRARGNP